MDYYFPQVTSDSTEGVQITQVLTTKHDGGANRLAHPDLISFLAAAQKYEVEFVPVVWEEGRGLLGEGGTAQINQTMLHTHLPVDPSDDPDPLKNTALKENSFAFKRTSQYQMEIDDLEAEGLSLYDILTREVVVLRQQAIRDHPNIVDLEGICWEVTKTNEIYPVLLFEKGQWGDLSSFASGLRGSWCTFNAKLGFCIDIAKALQIMHSVSMWFINGNCVSHKRPG